MERTELKVHLHVLHVILLHPGQHMACICSNTLHQADCVPVCWQAVTGQMLESGVEQMPHGKQYDPSYTPELLGIAPASMHQTTSSPDTAPYGQPSVHRQTDYASTAAASTANQSSQLQHAGADPQRAGQDGHAISSDVGALQQQPYRQNEQQSQGNRQQQTAAASSEVTLTQPDAATAHAAEVTSVPQHPQLQQQQQQEHQHYQQQPQQTTSGSNCTQLMETGGLQNKENCQQNARAAAGRSACSPARTGTSQGADHGSQAQWTPWAEFDVHSVLEVAPMKLLAMFYAEMAKVQLTAAVLTHCLDLQEDT